MPNKGTPKVVVRLGDDMTELMGICIETLKASDLHPDCGKSRFLRLAIWEYASKLARSGNVAVREKMEDMVRLLVVGPQNEIED